jgi:hypothetical protein
MKQKHKLTSQEQQQISETQTQQTATREFATAEELLRHDAAQTKVPPSVAKRLGKSVSQLPSPTQSWWRRFFGGTTK